MSPMKLNNRADVDTSQKSSFSLTENPRKKLYFVTNKKT